MQRTSIGEASLGPYVFVISAAWHDECETKPKMSPNRFVRFSRMSAQCLAHPLAFSGACASVVLWALCGPYFHYSDTWQLVINTGTTILTFLMVFLIQNTQNRDAKAMQLKLDELLRAVRTARNEMIELENLTEEELAGYCREFDDLHVRYRKEIEARKKKTATAKPLA